MTGRCTRRLVALLCGGAALLFGCVDESTEDGDPRTGQVDARARDPKLPTEARDGPAPEVDAGSDAGSDTGSDIGPQVDPQCLEVHAIQQVAGAARAQVDASGVARLKTSRVRDDRSQPVQAGS